MQVRMLHNIRPEQYNMPGDERWAGEIQYKSGAVYSFDSELAASMVYNGDAEYIKEHL